LPEPQPAPVERRLPVEAPRSADEPEILLEAVRSGQELHGPFRVLVEEVRVDARHGWGGETTAVRRNAYLARAGVASRRKADELIKSGRVLVNGEPGQPNGCGG